MKLLYLIIAVLIINKIVCSQSTYYAADYADTGDSVHLSKTSTGLGQFDFEQTGTDWTWNYDSLPYTTQEDIIWNDPADAGYKVLWCLQNLIIFNCGGHFADFTNMAVNDLDSFSFAGFEISNVVKHYYKSADAYEYKMLGETFLIAGLPVPKVIEINNVDTIYKFPLQYGNTDSSTCDYSIKILGDSTKYTTNYKRINIVEGWGVLTTPYGDFDNVLKIKSTVFKKDTFYLNGNPIPYTDTLVNYQWFDTDYAYPVLDAGGVLVAGNFIPTDIIYIDSLRCVDPVALFMYLPLFVYWDEDLQGATVNFTNLSSNADSCYWDFGNGDTSNDFNPAITFDCPGTYPVTLIVTSKVCDPYRMDTITIPVIVLDSAGYHFNQEVQTICNGDSVQWHGAWYSQEGSYYDSLYSVWECDSVCMLDLQFYPPFDSTPVITLSGDTLYSSYPFGNQWYYDYEEIPSANDSIYIATEDGSYFTIVTDTNGCISDTSNIIVINNTQASLLQNETFTIYPNPFDKCIYIEAEGIVKVILSDAGGRIIHTDDCNKHDNINIIGASDLVAGLYFIYVITNNDTYIRKIVKM